MSRHPKAGFSFGNYNPIVYLLYFVVFYPTSPEQMAGVSITLTACAMHLSYPLSLSIYFMLLPPATID